jgi:hypothetical protein
MFNPASPLVIKHSVLPFFVLIILLSSCYRKSVPGREDFPAMVAMTDDTIRNYAIAILQKHRFAYTIIYNNQQPTAKRDYYDGTWRYHSDTLFLHYYNKSPEGMTDYLVKEFTGGWLIQFFTDGRPRIFLRVQHRQFR